jgi:hypothetical protein
MSTGAVGSRELVVDGHLVVVHVRESRRARAIRLVVALGRVGFNNPVTVRELRVSGPRVPPDLA